MGNYAHIQKIGISGYCVLKLSTSDDAAVSYGTEENLADIFFRCMLYGSALTLLVGNRKGIWPITNVGILMI